MKIKNLFFCLLAVCVLTFSSCNKEENYAEKFTGTYTMTMTPSISVSVQGMGEIEIPVEATEGIKCVISEAATKNSVAITLYKENNPVFVFNGTCDETGMHIKTFTIDQVMDLDQVIDLGEVMDLSEADLDITFGGTTAAEPVDGKISWTNALTGTIGMEVEMAPGYAMPMEAELSGNMAFSGVKQ